MHKIKRIAILALVICLMATMLPTVPLVSAEDAEVVLTGIEIGVPPVKTEYWTGESLDTAGLTLLATYSDGSTIEISEGFAVSGFDSSTAGEKTLTVAYQGKTVTFAVTVNQPEITHIAIDHLPVKTEYWTGESLDTTGLTLAATYSDGNTVEITEGFTVSGFDCSVAGQQTLTVTYMGATDTFAVTVKKLEVTGIAIVTPPQKTEYWEGEQLETDGLTLVVSYPNGDTAEVTEGFTVSGFDSSVAGQQTLTVSYMGATAAYTVTVKKLEVRSIKVHTLPNKTQYYTGEELDTTGLTLLVTYLNGTQDQITEGFTVTGFDKNLAGQQVLTVWYGDAAAEFSVYVEERYLIDIVISTPPEKTVYWIGESLDTTGLVLTATYSDGSIQQITEGYTVSDFNSTTAGTKVVTVGYDGGFAVLNVEVKAPTSSTITGIEICTLPTKTEYFVGEKKDWTGLSLYVVYSDGSKEVITSGWLDSGFNSTTAGTKTIRLVYKLKRTSFTVTVKEVEPTGIEITTQPAKTEYWVGEGLDTTGLTVSETYSDGSTVEITDYTVSGFDSATAGEKTVTVTYEEQTAVFTVTVVCLHTQMENGLCTMCQETMVATVTDSAGNPVGNFAALADALADIAAGCRITLLTDTWEESVLLVGVVLDLNGHTLTAGLIDGAVIDTSENADGLLKLTEGGNAISPNNPQLPVYDHVAGGYRFFTAAVTPKAITGGNKYWFTVDIENFEKFYTLILSGAEVRIQVKMTWEGQSEDVYAVADLAFTQKWANRCKENSDSYITVSVTENQGVENFILSPGITSSGVEVFGEGM